MAPITEAVLVLSLLSIVKHSASLNLGGRSAVRMAKYRLRPVIVYRQPEYDYKEPAYPEASVQEPNYPEYDYYSQGKADYDTLAELYGKNNHDQEDIERTATFFRPVSTVPPMARSSTLEPSPMPKPTPLVHRFNRGQKEFPMLRPPTESRQAGPFRVIKDFDSSRIKPAVKNFADILSAELEHLKSRTH